MIIGYDYDMIISIYMNRLEVAYWYFVVIFLCCFVFNLMSSVVISKVLRRPI